MLVGFRVTLGEGAGDEMGGIVIVGATIGGGDRSGDEIHVIFASASWLINPL